MAGRLGLYQNTAEVDTNQNAWVSLQQFIFWSLLGSSTAVSALPCRNIPHREASVRREEQTPVCANHPDEHGAARCCCSLRLHGRTCRPHLLLGTERRLSASQTWPSSQHTNLAQIFACPGNRYTLKPWPCWLTTCAISTVQNFFYCVKNQTSVSAPLCLTLPTGEMGLPIISTSTDCYKT